MANDKDLKVRIPVSPELDKNAVTKLRKDLSGLTKDLSKIGLNYKNLAKVSQMNVKELKTLSDGAKALGVNLSKGAQKAYEELGKTTKKIDSARQKASKLEKESAEAGSRGDKPAQNKADKEFTRITKTVSNLNKVSERQRKTAIKYDAETRRGIKTQQKNISKLQSTAGFGKADTAKGILSGLGKAVSGGKAGFLPGIKEAGGAAAKGVGGVAARGVEAGGDVAAMAKMGQAMGAIAGAGAAFGVFVKMLMMASDHMTKLNKALIAGTGLANDFAMTGEQYRNTVDSLRQAAIDSHGSLLKFGMDSEASLQAVNAFAKGATGSLGRTKVMLEEMGKGDLSEGMLKFAKSAKIYGAALGKDTTEVSQMMGDMVSDIGYTGNVAMQNMQNLIKTAATSGMPVQKFMDVFGQVLPSIDLFTNRIEQLTGTIKLLSKTMSPGDVKNFMQAMGKGFDEMDFKQRMKMEFVIGPKEAAGILQKDFKASGDAIATDFGSLGDEVKSALQTADPVKAMAAVAAKATALGISSAAIGDAQELARNMASLKKGNVLDIATAMRGAGMFARTKMLEKYAQKLTPGKDMSGLGEYVAKTLGVSEQEYAAILSLKNNMATYQDMLMKTGRTSSKSINAGLLKVWKENKKQTTEGKEQLALMSKSQIDAAFKQDMKDMATKRPKEMEDAILLAASVQQSGSEDQAKSAEELAAEQYNVQASISDKLQNIVGFWLEKIFDVLQPMLNVLDSLFDWFASGDDKKKQKEVVAEQSRISHRSAAAGRAAAVQAPHAGKNKEALAGMFQVIKDAANFSQGDMGPGAITTKLTPILKRAGDMSVKAFDQQKKALGGVTGSESKDIELRTLLKQAEEAKSQKNVGAEKAAREEAAKLVKNTMTELLDTKKDEKAFQFAGSVAGALAQSGVNIGGPGDPHGVSTRKPTPSEKADAKAQSDSVEGFIDELNKAGTPGAGVSRAPSAPYLFSSGPSTSVGSGAKSASGGQQEIASAATENVDVAKDQLSVGESQNQTVNNILSELKGGLMLKGMSPGLKSVFDKIVLDNVETALINYLMITDPDKVPKWALEKGGSSLGASKQLVYSAKKSILGVPTTAVPAVGHANGGYTGDGPSTKLAGVVHRGEFVVPKGGALVSGGGGRNVNVGTVNIHVQTNDPHEIRRVIDDVFNQGH